MRKRLIVKCALLSFIVLTSALHANEDQDAAENVIRRAYTSIARIEEGKIFLKPEKLSLKKGIIYLEDIDGARFAIPAVFSSGGRPYVQVGESIIFNSWKCGKCGFWNHKWDYPTHCGYCNEAR
jgi:hypothetical protein